MVDGGVIQVQGKDGLALVVRRAPSGGYELEVGRDGAQRLELWGCAVKLSTRIAMLGATVPASTFGFLRYDG